MKRKIICIDEAKCTGCGQCIPDCPEGALQLIEGKARLVSDLFCDGLGACTGTCPEGAISVVEREAVPYDERTVMRAFAEQGAPVIKAHLEHIAGHGQTKLYDQAIEYLTEKDIQVAGSLLDGTGPVSSRESSRERRNAFIRFSLRLPILAFVTLQYMELISPPAVQVPPHEVSRRAGGSHEPLDRMIVPSSGSGRCNSNY